MHRAGLEHVPPLEKERGGVSGPALPSPTLRAGDSKEAESRRGRPFFVVVIDVGGG